MKEGIDRVLIIVGGLMGLINGIVDFTGKPIGSYVFGIDFGITAPLIYVLGFLGVIGGLMALYFGVFKPNKLYTLIGSILAILGLCGVAVLALIGALLMKE